MVVPWCKLQYKHSMLKQRYDLLKDHYSQLTSGMDKSAICESHLQQIHKLQSTVYKLQHASVSVESSSGTIDRESLQIRLLRGQYEREKLRAETCVKEITS